MLGSNWTFHEAFGDLSPYGPGPFDWQKHSVQTLRDYHYYILGVALAYCPLIWFLGKWMENREPYKFGWIFTGWNLLLAGFSTLAALHLVPIVVDSFNEKGLQGTVCNREVFHQHDSYWIFYFALSKGPEFIDTIFLRLRKRPVITLHWYHHIMTFMYCWYSNQIAADYHGIGFLFGVMNLIVHSFMYTYFALASRGYRKVMSAMGADIVLTSMQILQMAAGIWLTVASRACPNQEGSENMLLFSAIMYGSYFYLFGKLFVDKYMKSKTTGKDGKPAKSSSDSAKPKKA